MRMIHKKRNGNKISGYIIIFSSIMGGLSILVFFVALSIALLKARNVALAELVISCSLASITMFISIMVVSFVYRIIKDYD